MAFYNAFDDGEAVAVAQLAAAVAGSEAGVENVGDIVRGDAPPGVADAQHRLSLFYGEADPDLASLPRVLDRVADQIVQHPLELVGVQGQMDGVWGQVRQQGDLLGPAAALLADQCFGDQGSQIGGFKLGAQSGLDIGKVQQILDQIGDMGHIFLKPLDVVLGLWVVQGHTLEQGQFHADGRQRVAHVVGGRGHQFIFEGADFLEEGILLSEILGLDAQSVGPFLLKLGFELGLFRFVDDEKSVAMIDGPGIVDFRPKVCQFFENLQCFFITLVGFVGLD